MTTYLADTETTGLKEPQVIELAWMRLGQGGIAETPAEERRFRPNKRIEYGAMATHHITEEDLADCPPSHEARLPEDCTHLVGHNVDYDWECLGRPPMKRICTLALARGLFPDDEGHSLGALAYRLWGREAQALLKGAHSAIVDVGLTYRILHIELGLLRDRGLAIVTIGDLWAISERCRIPTIMPFGKYRGRPVGEVDKGWIAWAFKQPDMDPYVLRALRGERGGLTP